MLIIGKFACFNSLFKKPTSNLALCITSSAPSIKVKNSIEISLKRGLLDKKLLSRPCTANAASGILLPGFKYVCHSFPVGILTSSSTQPISTILCPSKGFKPVVSVSNAILLIKIPLIKYL